MTRFLVRKDSTAFIFSPAAFCSASLIPVMPKRNMARPPAMPNTDVRTVLICELPSSFSLFSAATFAADSNFTGPIVENAAEKRNQRCVKYLLNPCKMGRSAFEESHFGLTEDRGKILQRRYCGTLLVPFRAEKKRRVTRRFFSAPISLPLSFPASSVPGQQGGFLPFPLLPQEGQRPSFPLPASSPPPAGR